MDGNRDNRANSVQLDWDQTELGTCITMFACGSICTHNFDWYRQNHEYSLYKFIPNYLNIKFYIKDIISII